LLFRADHLNHGFPLLHIPGSLELSRDLDFFAWNNLEFHEAGKCGRNPKLVDVSTFTENVIFGVGATIFHTYGSLLSHLLTKLRRRPLLGDVRIGKKDTPRSAHRRDSEKETDFRLRRRRYGSRAHALQQLKEPKIPRQKGQVREPTGFGQSPYPVGFSGETASAQDYADLP
jgi:hypothetical protein